MDDSDADDDECEGVAYMFDAAPHQVYDGIGGMVAALLRHA